MPLTPEELAKGLSADDPNAPDTEFPRLPAPAAPQTLKETFPAGVDPFQIDQTTPENRQAGVDWLRSQGVQDGDAAGYRRLQEQNQRETERLAAEATRTAEAESASAARAQAAAETKKLRESGVKMTVDATNRPVPETRPDGSTVFEPGWVGAERFDDKTKAWVQDFRDEKGNLTPKDLYAEGKIKRDEDTGDLFLTAEGGARRVVGKDENFLRRRAIGQEISTLTRQQEEADLALDKDRMALKPLEGQFAEKKKLFEETSERMRNMLEIGKRNPGWTAANGEKLQAVTAEFEAAKKDFLPLRSQFDAVEKRKQELEAAKIKTRERKLTLYAERDVIDAAAYRPEFSAPAAASPTEDPAVTAEREKNGIAGDNYQIPDLITEESEFRKRMNALDAEASAVPAEGLGPNIDRDGKLAAINARKREEIKAFGGRKAALEKFAAEERALRLDAASAEGRANAKRFLVTKNQARLDDELARGVITPRAYRQALALMERDIAQEDATRGALMAKRSELRKTTAKALRQPDEFPETLITRRGAQADLDPRAVEVRAAGRAAAFGTSQADELYETLLEIQDSGKIQMVGGRPIRDVIREVGGQKSLKVEDFLTSEEADALRQGLRGGLITHQKALLHNVYGQELDIAQRDGSVFATPGKLTVSRQDRARPMPALDGEETLTKPVSDRAEAIDFWKQTFAAALSPSGRPAGQSPSPAVPQFARELQSELDTLRNAQPDPDLYAAAPDKAKFLRDFNTVKQNRLETFYQRELAKGGDRAAWVQQFRSAQQPQEFGQALAEELAGRFRAAVFSPTAGVWDVGAGLLDTLSHVEALGRGIAPEETGLHEFAKAARQGTADLMGEKSDTLVAQIGRGVGSSLAFAPAAMVGGLPAVAGMGAASAFGSGYFEAKEKAAAKGKQISEFDAYLRATVAAGLGTLEGVPVARALDRLNKATGGSVKRLLSSLQEGAEEFGQEFIQGAVQGFYDSLAGLDDRTWKQILGEGMEGGTVAGLSGLLMGIGMNAMGVRGFRRETGRIETAFGTTDKVYSQLTEAVRSPEALFQFNAARPASQRVSMAKAIDMLGQVEKARNSLALQVLARDEKLLNETIAKAAPGADVAKMAEAITSRPGVLSEVAALGRDLGNYVLPPGQISAPPALRDVVAGHVVLSKLQTVLEGGSVETALGQALEKQGLLVQKPTPTGGTRWVLSGPALSLMDGEVRRAVVRNPQKFAYAPEADTSKPGQLTQDLKREGAARISQAINPNANNENQNRSVAGGSATSQSGSKVSGSAAGVPTEGTASQGPSTVQPAQSQAPASQGSQGSGTPTSFKVTLTSEPDASGFTTKRTVTVQAATPEAAGPAALELTRGWRGKWTPGEILPDQPAGQTLASGNETGTAPGTSDAVREGTGESQAAGSGLGTTTGTAGAGDSVSAAGNTGGSASNAGGNGSAGVVLPVSAKTPAAGGSGVPAGTASVEGESTEVDRVRQAWAGRSYDLDLVKRALAKFGISVTRTNAKPTLANLDRVGDITINFNPEEMAGTDYEANSTADEELRHVAAYVAKRRQWEAAGSPGSFEDWFKADAMAIFEDLMARVRELEGTERAEVERAMLASFNLYFSPFLPGARQAETFEALESLLRSGVPGTGPVPVTVSAFIHEFARQLSQLRDANSISEETHRGFLDALIQWIQDAVQAVRGLAAVLDAEGNVLDGTALQRLVLDMDAEMRWLNGEINAAGLAEMRKDIARDAAAPVMNWLAEQGGVIGKGKAVNPGGEYDDALPVTVLGGYASKVYGTALRPDEAAQELFNAGLLPEPSPSAMWDAIASEVKTLRALVGDALTPQRKLISTIYARQTLENLREKLAEVEKSSGPAQAREKAIADLQRRIKRQERKIADFEAENPGLQAKPRKAAPSEKNSTQINLPADIAREFVAFGRSIPDSDLYTAEPGYGRETKPHVTVLYGLEADPAAVQRAMAGFGPVTLRFGPTSLFESEKYDVLKVEILGEDIRRLNAAMQRAFPTPSDFPTYNPHATIAYLKKGAGRKYVGDSRFAGRAVTAGEFVFSDRQEATTPIALQAKPRPGGDSLFDTPETSFVQGQAGTRFRPRNIIQGVMSPDFAYEIQNNTRVPAGHRLIASRIYERKIAGEHPLFRLNVVEAPSGERYSLIERGADRSGNTMGARTEFQQISEADLDFFRKFEPVTVAARGFWEEHAADVRPAARTIETTGEGQIFSEEELPFNLVGEVDTTAIRQAEKEAREAAEEAKRRAESGQMSLFAKPRGDQLGFDFALQTTEAAQPGLEFFAPAPGEAPAVPPTQAGFAFEDPVSQMGQSPADPSPVPEKSAPEPVQDETRIADFGEKIGGARKDTAKPLGPRAQVTSSEPEDTRPAWMRKYIPAKKLQTLWGQYNAATGRYERQTVETGKWVLLRKDGISVRSPEFDSEAEAAAGIPLVEFLRNHGFAPMRGADEWVIYRKVGERKRPIVKRGFASESDAMRYAAEHTAELIEFKFQFPTRPWLDNLQRTGGTERQGDVTPRMFQDTFGFRAGEFGNWNMGGDGQAALNFAYDALLDLADILGVAPRALSLNGQLAIAFGARGTGGKQSAAAHYEPDYRVINLTKINGAGSLAHEWFHALDHYLGTFAGGSEYASKGFSYQSTARPELKEAFRNVMNATVARKEERTITDEGPRKNFERQTEWLRGTLKSIRESMERYHEWVKRAKRPTAEQLEKFDAIALRIAALQVGEKVYIPGQSRMSIGRESFEAIEELNVLYKQVTGRSFSTADEGSAGRKVFWQVKAAQSALDRVNAAAAGATEIRTVSTDFLLESRKIDELRSSDYWSTPWEMGARSFEAFVADKLANSERRNDYLVSGADNRFYVLFDQKPYPEGNERLAINAAWQKVWDVIEQETGDGGKVALRAKPRNTAQRWMDFGPAGSQLEKFQLPLTFQEFEAQATPEERSLFQRNLGLAYKIAGDFFNVGEREDVRQEALIALARASKRYAGAGEFTTFAGRVIRNHLLDLYSRGMRQVQADSLEANLGETGRTLEDVTASTAETPAVSAQRQEALTALQEVISSLPADLRDIITRRLAGETQEQVGRARGITKQSISEAEKIAMGMIRSRMKSRGIDGIPLRAKPRDPDAAYLELAKNPAANLAELQQMVDQAAQAAGYTRKVFHGTEDGGFVEFDPERTSKKTGFVYFSTGRGTAASYSGSRQNLPAGSEGRGIWTLYLKEPEQVWDFEEAGWDGMRPDGSINEWYDFGGIDGIARDAKDMGVKSFEVQNVLDEGPNGDTAWYDSTIAVADSSLVKSADPVTYDEAGNVIPLSQRFNSQTSNILRAKPRDTQATFDRALNADIFPPENTAPIPGPGGPQETFTGRLDREIFPQMPAGRLPAEPDRTVTPEQAEDISDVLMRDARDIADVIATKPEDPAFTPGQRTTIRDHFTTHLRGRFDKLNYFAPGAGDVLLDAQRDDAHFAAAVRRFNEALDEKLRAAFGYPSWWRNPKSAARLARFKATILPYAAALNPVRRDGAGDFVWEAFWQRSGELSGAQVENMNRRPGEEWVDAATGERWRIGEFVQIEGRGSKNGKVDGFYQLERWIPAEVQATMHEAFHEQFPEAAWLLDDFIEPGMEAERVVSAQGVELPTFNRHSLYGFYGDTPAGLVEKLPGYTPDVARTKSLAGMAAKILKLDWKSPGRDYKSGQARVTGQVRDLFEGFNIRAAQAHMESARRKNAELLLKATLRPVPDTGLPEDFRRLDRDTLNPLIRAMRSASGKGQAEMPEILENATERLTAKNLETLRFLFGDPALFDEKQMIHKEVLAELERGFVRLRVDNAFLDGMMNWIRGNVAGVLADLQTISINKLSNYIFHTLRAAQRTAYAGFSALAGEKVEARRAIREAGFLVQGFFTNFYHPAIRERMNRLVPPEVFEDQNILRQLLSDTAELSVVDLLKQANVGAAFLKAVGYGEMDVKAKQKLALASMLSRASIAADEAGITGADRREWMRRWVETAPIEARREAEVAAKLFLMDYANVPWWLDQGRKIEIAGRDVTPWANFVRALAIPFWKYPYNYLRQMKRLGVDSAAALTWKRKLATKQERREAAANLTSLAMLLTAYWLLTRPWGEDDEEILGRDVNDAGEELDPKLRTSSRVRLADSSALGAIVGTAARMFGAEDSEDLWVRTRTLPYATQAMALGAALNYLSDPSSGDAKTAMDSAWDMVEDFMSVGSGARLGLTFMGYRDDYTRHQTLPFILGQGAVDMLMAQVLPPRALKDVATFIDPVNRRYDPSKSLDYSPSFVEGVISKIPGLTKSLPPSGKVQGDADPNSEKTRAARAELEALGVADLAYREYLDKKTGKLRAAYVRPEFIYTIPGWKALVRQAGFNVKAVPRDEYQAALAGEE